MKMTMMMTRGEGADEEEDGAGGVLRASGAPLSSPLSSPLPPRALT
jgi:hypothetical protein